MIGGSQPQEESQVDPGDVPGPRTAESGAAPRWVDRLFLALLIYASVMSAWMLSGFGGPTVTHYVGLVSDMPAELMSITIAAATARNSARGPLRRAWNALAVAQGLYFIGTAIGVSSWLQNQDPFPGPRRWRLAKTS